MAKSKQKQKPISTEDFYSISHVEDPQVHPDGKRIAYVMSTPQHEGKSYLRSIWVADSPRKKPRQFTAGGKGGDFSPCWSPDGKTLAFVSSRSGKPQIYLIPIDGGEARPLTQMGNGATSPVWSPDSKSIAFLSSTLPDERKSERKTKSPSISQFESKQQDEQRKHEEQERMDPRYYNRTVFKHGTVFLMEEQAISISRKSKAVNQNG